MALISTNPCTFFYSLSSLLILAWRQFFFPPQDQEDESTPQPPSINSSLGTNGLSGYDASQNDETTAKNPPTSSSPSTEFSPTDIENDSNFVPGSSQSSPEPGNQVHALVDPKATYKAIAPLAVAMAPSTFALAMSLPLKSNQTYVVAALLNIYLLIFVISVELVVLIVFIPQSIKDMMVMKGLLGLGIGLFVVAFPLQVLISLPHNWIFNPLCGVAAFMAAFLFYLTMRIHRDANKERENIEV
ncbi:uncharacterized protein LOC110006572 [Amborella trichopoda]|uniref:PGG domain-containing protein n=1 Tax=Amborella trichopoda TaxID=13333 RepID=W1NR84_AMBTC|nr:uncharacterized protein LOC110006572 [Amborella trichopoda]ERM98337.1 hypothetical protein AMTR_s00170p00039490 [Amborella trichopoda]|eukprot:XP_020518105.1 uncharacterized protein LOC110006572 [Amborella trichopoda]